MEQVLQRGVTWSEWAVIGLPYSAVISLALYGLLCCFLPADMSATVCNREYFRQALSKLGPMTGAEKRLAVLILATVLLWSTESLHRLDVSTVALVALGPLLLPDIGIMTWKEAQARMPWGTIALFGASLSLATVLLNSHAAVWLAERTFGLLGVRTMTLLSLIAAITGFAIVIHLGFSSATALAATLIPVVLGFLQGLDLPAETIWWIVLLTHVSINCGFILPVNSPQNMVAYATGTFNVWDFVRIGLPLALVAYIVLLVFSVTYWRWLGLSL